MHVAKIEQSLKEAIKAREQLPLMRTKLLAALERANQLLAARQPSDETDEGDSVLSQEDL